MVYHVTYLTLNVVSIYLVQISMWLSNVELQIKTFVLQTIIIVEKIIHRYVGTCYLT